MSEYTANADALGTLRLLNAIRICGLEKKCRFYQVRALCTQLCVCVGEKRVWPIARRPSILSATVRVTC